MTGDNEYSSVVYDEPSVDSRTTSLQRALHAELCRGPHGDHYSACARAAAVVRRWLADRETS